MKAVYCVSIAGVLLLHSAAAQQKVIVDPAVQVNPDDRPWKEASVAALRGDPNEVVVAAMDAFLRGVFYRTSCTGGATWEPEEQLPGASSDPGLVVDPEDDFVWLVSTESSLKGVRIAWKAPGSAVFEEPYDLVSDSALPFASSAEFVGEFWLGQACQGVI